jgi:hypothetical protein
LITLYIFEVSEFNCDNDFIYSCPEILSIVISISSLGIDKILSRTQPPATRNVLLLGLFEIKKENIFCSNSDKEKFRFNSLGIILIHIILIF